MDAKSKLLKSLIESMQAAGKSKEEIAEAISSGKESVPLLEAGERALVKKEPNALSQLKETGRVEPRQQAHETPLLSLEEGKPAAQQSLVTGPFVDALKPQELSTSAPKKSALSKLIGGAVVLGGVPAMTEEDKIKENKKEEQKTPKLNASMTALQASVGSADASEPERKNKATPARVKTYTPEDVKAMLREVDKTPFSYDISKEEKELFQKTRDDIANKNADLIKIYKAEIKAAKDEKTRKDTIVNYAQAFETIGLALTTFFAAKKGMELGQDVSKGVRDIKPSDWMSMTKQHLADYEAERKASTDVVEMEKGLLDSEDKQNNSSEREAKSNAFSLGREEAKRRDDISSDNIKTQNRANEINTKEKNDALAANIKAQNLTEENNADRAFRIEENNKNRDSREGIANVKAEAAVESASLRAAKKIGLDPAKMNNSQVRDYAEMQAAFSVLEDNPNDKQAKKSLITSVIKQGKTAEEANMLAEEATRSGISKAFSPSNAREQMNTMAPMVSSAPVPTRPSPRGVKFMYNGKVVEVTDPIKIEEMRKRPNFQEVK